MNDASAPRDLTTTIVSVRDEAAGARTFRLAVPPDFRFIPGMWVMLQFPDKAEKAGAYSISSSPFEAGQIALSLCKVGPLTQRLFAAAPGQELLLRGPYGKWLYDERAPHAVLITDGTGITPYRSMGRYVMDAKLANTLTFLYSARTAEHFLYHDDLDKFEKHGFKVYKTVTHPEEGGVWNGPTGPVTIGTIEREVKDFMSAHFYLCGPKSLIDGLKESLLARNIPREQLRYENWGDYTWD